MTAPGQTTGPATTLEEIVITAQPLDLPGIPIGEVPFTFFDIFQAPPAGFASDLALRAIESAILSDVIASAVRAELQPPTFQPFPEAEAEGAPTRPFLWPFVFSFPTRTPPIVDVEIFEGVLTTIPATLGAALILGPTLDLDPIPPPPGTLPQTIESGIPTETGVQFPGLIPLPPFPPRNGNGGTMAELPDILAGIGAAATGAARLVSAFNPPDFGGGFGAPFGTIGMPGLSLALGGAATACPPARPRMPSSLQMADPCAPNNPTFYLRAGKASAAMWPGVLAGQAKKLARANKAVPKKTVRRKKGK